MRWCACVCSNASLFRRSFFFESAMLLFFEVVAAECAFRSFASSRARHGVEAMALLILLAAFTRRRQREQNAAFALPRLPPDVAQVVGAAEL